MYRSVKKNHELANNLKHFLISNKDIHNYLIGLTISATYFFSKSHNI